MTAKYRVSRFRLGTTHPLALKSTTLLIIPGIGPTTDQSYTNAAASLQIIILTQRFRRLFPTTRNF